MNRRQFTKSLAAAGLVPLMPAIIPSASAAVAAPIASSKLYPWAAYYAQIHNKCSPELLANHLKIPMDVAQGLFDKLVARGSVTAPNLAGISQAVKPYYKNLRAVGGVIKPKASTPKPANSSAKLKLAKDEEPTDIKEPLTDNVDQEILTHDEETQAT